MEVDSAIGGLLLFVIALTIAFVAGAEVALAAASRGHIRKLMEDGVRRAAIVDALLAEPARFLTTLMLLKSAAFAGSGAVVFWLSVQNKWSVSNLLLIWAGTWFALVCLQIIGRAMALRFAEQTALLLAPGVRIVAGVMAPLSLILLKLGATSRGDTDRLTEESIFLSEDGLRFLIDVSEGESEIEEEEKQMIASIFELGETVVREIMVPRIDIVAINENSSLQEAIDVILEKGHSRIPVYEENVDQIIGFLYAKDLLRCFRNGQQETPIRDLLRPAYFVPETKKVDELFNEMRKRRVHIAVVVDEYGGTSGLVTIEDLLEEIVGEIQDEYDFEEPVFQELGPEKYIFNARMALDDVSDLLGVELAFENADTLGGFLYSQLGHVPEAGETVEYEGWQFTVLSVESRRIEKVRVERVEQPDSLQAGADGKLTNQDPSELPLRHDKDERSSGWSILSLL